MENALDDNAGSTRNASIRTACEFEKHDWLLVKFVFMSVIGTAVALFGIFSNTLIVAVLSKPSMRTANNLYLTVLALFDTLVLIPGIALYCMEYVNEYFDRADLYVQWIEWVPYCYSLSHFAQTGSVYVTVSVTFERYLAVVRPKIAAVHCTRHRTALAIIAVTCFSALFNCTKLSEIVVAHNNTCTGFASRELVASDLLSDELYSTVYSLWLTHFVMVFFPFCVLLTFNTAIAWNFKRSLRHLAYVGMPMDQRNLKEQSRDATRVLVTIVLVFLICNCWGFVTTLMESIYSVGALKQWAPGFYTFSREVVNFLAIVNSSINFVICCVFGEDFRHELLKMCGLRRPGRGFPHNFVKIPRASPRGKSPVIFQVAQHRPSRLRYVDRLSLEEDEPVHRSSPALMEAGKSILVGLPQQCMRNGSVGVARLQLDPAESSESEDLIAVDTPLESGCSEHSIHSRGLLLLNTEV